MRKIITITSITMALLFSGMAMAAEHSYVTSIRHDIPKENVYRVNIDKVDGNEPDFSANVRVKPGSHEIVVTLVFNSMWSASMGMTQDNIYYKTFNLDVKAGKTYHIGATVDTHASKEEQDAGSFWEPVVHKVD